MGYSEGSIRIVNVSSHICHFETRSEPSLTLERSALGWNNLLAALFGIVKLSSRHIAKIGTDVVSMRASFIKIIFCNVEGAPEVLACDGGPNGGNGLVDIEAFVGLVMADEDELLPPWVELLPEPTDDGTEYDPDPTEPKERCLAALVICLGFLDVGSED